MNQDSPFFILQLDADNYETDPELAKIRKEKKYSWMDIITIRKDTLPNYEEKVTTTALFELWEDCKDWNLPLECVPVLKVSTLMSEQWIPFV